MKLKKLIGLVLLSLGLIPVLLMLIFVDEARNLFLMVAIPALIFFLIAQGMEMVEL